MQKSHTYYLKIVLLALVSGSMVAMDLGKESNLDDSDRLRLECLEAKCSRLVTQQECRDEELQTLSSSEKAAAHFAAKSRLSPDELNKRFGGFLPPSDSKIYADRAAAKSRLSPDEFYRRWGKNSK